MNRIFNIEPEPIAYTKCPIYTLKKSIIKDFVDLRDTDSAVDNQGMLGSCAANALVNVYENMLIKFQPELFTDLSRLFVYYNTRILEETIKEDFGVIYLSNALESVKTLGVCEEKFWPYDISKFTTRPSDLSYEDALKRRIPSYSYITDRMGVKEILSTGNPVLIGMKVFRSFMGVNKENSLIPMPDTTDVYLGGHAVSVVGYTTEGDFIIKNSFGVDWGDKGYAFLPAEYMDLYVFDRWNFSLPVVKEEGQMLLDNAFAPFQVSMSEERMKLYPVRSLLEFLAPP